MFLGFSTPQILTLSPLSASNHATWRSQWSSQKYYGCIATTTPRFRRGASAHSPIKGFVPICWWDCQLSIWFNASAPSSFYGQLWSVHVQRWSATECWVFWSAQSGWSGQLTRWWTQAMDGFKDSSILLEKRKPSISCQMLGSAHRNQTIIIPMQHIIQCHQSAALQTCQCHKQSQLIRVWMRQKSRYWRHLPLKAVRWKHTGSNNDSFLNAIKLVPYLLSSLCSTKDASSFRMWEQGLHTSQWLRSFWLHEFL